MERDSKRAGPRAMAPLLARSLRCPARFQHDEHGRIRMSEERDHEPDPPADKVADLERQADEAHRRLADTERQADERLEQAEDELRTRTSEQEATAERLRREVREPTGPLLPQEPKAEEHEGEKA